MKMLDDCPACGSDIATDVAVLDSQRHSRYLEFSRSKFGGLLDGWLQDFEPVVRHCQQCGHYWYRYQPDPSQLAEMYAAGKPLTESGTVNREPSARMVAEMRRLRRLIPASDAQPHLLDYGSGFGRWAKAAMVAGFKVTAYEPSAERGADSSAPFELVHSLDELRGRKFAAVQLEQVLEHVSDPLETMTSISSLCQTDTIVRITVPNMRRSEEGKRLWELWPYDGKSPHILAPYEHLHGFTPRSLDALIRRARFAALGPFALIPMYSSNVVRSYVGKLVPSLGLPSGW